LQNGREFDIFDIAANVLGSLAAVGICLWYHKRMLERKRRSKTGTFLGDDGEEFDVELGEGIDPQEQGIVIEPTLEEEVDNWDENGEDWDDEPTAAGSLGDDSTKTTTSEDAVLDSKVRSD
jgi:hypothetical protein